MQLERAKLIEIIKGTCDGKHHYEWGAKPDPDDAPDTWTLADCSGLMTYTLERAWGIRVVGGSVDIHTWCDHKALKEVKYSNVGPLADNIFRLCFIAPKGGKPGHVWGLVSGDTFESCGNKGCCRQLWTVYKDRCIACFEIGTLV
jgi:hypothetical protein